MTLKSEPVHKDDPGTYIALLPQWSCAYDVNKWMQRIGIVQPVAANELHVTLAYSDKVVEGFQPDGYDRPPIRVSTYNTRYAMFGEQSDVLVLLLFSSAIERRHYQLKSYGFRTKQNPRISAGFSAHMTLSYSYSGDYADLPPPTTIGRFLTFNREIMSPLKDAQLNSDGWQRLRGRFKGKRVIQSKRNWMNWALGSSVKNTSA